MGGGILSGVINTRRLSDLSFSIDQDLNVKSGNRSFLIFLQKTEVSGINLDSILYEYDAKNLRFFLQTYKNIETVEPWIFTAKLRINEKLISCIFTIKKNKDLFDVAIEEISYSRKILDSALLESREYSALLQNFDAYYFIYEDEKFYIKNTKDLNTVFCGNEEEFYKTFISLFKLNTEVGDCKGQLKSMLENIKKFESGKYYDFLRTDKKRISVHILKTSTRSKSIIVGSINSGTRNIPSENFYAESHDGLTGLYNKVAITELAQRKINQEKVPCTLLIIDIDKFKECNDTYGHMFGDKVLAFAASCIKEAIGSKGIAGRIGGDEFLVLLDSTEEDDVRNVARNIRIGIQWNITSLEPTSLVTCSMGIARYPLNGKTYAGLFKLADKCLYIAKDRGRNCYVIYRPELHEKMFVEDRKKSNKILSGQLYNEDAEKEYKILKAIRDRKSEDDIKPILKMLIDYLAISKITIYNSELKYACSAGKDKEDFRKDALHKSDYFEFFNKFGYLHLDNTNVLASVEQRKYSIYRDNNIATTLEVLCFDENKNRKGLVCYDVYRPATTFPKEKIVFMLVITKMIGRYFVLKGSDNVN